MKNIITLTTFILLFSFNTQAAGLGIEPIYGIERSQRMYPEPPTYKTKTFVGLRATYGVSLLSGELEVSQSNSQDEFPDTDEKVKYSTQRAMLGIRSYPIRSKYVGLFFRAGARAQKETREIDKAGVVTKEEDPINFDPYAGTGLTLAFANNFALSAGATLMYNRNAQASEQYDTQYTFSFTIRAGNK